MYIDAIFDRKSDQINVVERKNGKREFVYYPARYTFYYDDPKGKHRSIYGTPVTRVVCKNTKTFQKEKRILSDKNLYESDINPINQCLHDNYMNSEPPKLHVCLWDIETDFCSKRGFSPPSDPFSPITSITLYQQWCDKLITLAVPPKTLSLSQAKEMCNEWGDDVILFDNEPDMLRSFLECIEDADVLSGWNCSTYDIPYTINRITKVLGKSETRKMCLWGQLPKPRSFERFGKEQKTYDLCGRVNLDYLDLYKNYTYEERSSYKLDSIGELEVGERKTEYEGTLDQLYNNDFKLFITYNRQDVILLDKLDKKFEYIDLTITSAHESTVLMPVTMGSVAIIEQSIINEAHEHGLVIPDKKRSQVDDTSMAGGYVGRPRKGVHDWIGSVDLNSLYPSTIRSLNMAPETLVGQIRQTLTQDHIDNVIKKGGSFASAWDEKFSCIEYEMVMDQRHDQILIIDWENGGHDELSGAQIYQLIFNSNKPWMLSANGTIFTTEKKGVIPDLLTKWYSERKLMQKQYKNWLRLAEGIELREELL